PYMSERTGPWIAWTATEVRPDGQPVFDSETIYDASGRLCVSKASKRTDAGLSATKIAFNLFPPAPGMLQQREAQGVSLEQDGRTDFSASDFLYFYVSNPSNALRNVSLVDGGGRKVQVGKGDSNYRQRVVSRWPVGSANVRWLPNAALPQQ